MTCIEQVRCLSKAGVHSVKSGIKARSVDRARSACEVLGVDAVTNAEEQ